MTGESAYLRTLASGVVACAIERLPVQAAVLAGSAGRGNADRFSDLDILFYVDSIPTNADVNGLRRAVRGTGPVRRQQSTADFGSTEFELSGVRTEIAFFTVRYIEAQLDRLLDRLEDVTSPAQKLLSGLDEAMALHGEALIAGWKARLRPFPEPLRKAMIEQHWNFFAIWHHAEAMAARDSELWRLDVLLDGAFNLLGVLAGLNRLYYARFELKRTRDLVAQMQLAPTALADRLEALFQVPPTEAATAFGALIQETLTLVHNDLPEVKLALPRPLGSRQTPWPMALPHQPDQSQLAECEAGGDGS